MYQNVLGYPITAMGVAALPNTGGNEVLLIASITMIVIGLVVVLSTASRQMAKKAYKA